MNQVLPNRWFLPTLFISLLGIASLVSASRPFWDGTLLWQVERISVFQLERVDVGLLAPLEAVRK